MLSSVFILFFCSETVALSYNNAMARGREGGKEPTCAVALQAKIDLVDNRLHESVDYTGQPATQQFVLPACNSGENYAT